MEVFQKSATSLVGTVIFALVAAAVCLCACAVGGRIDVAHDGSFRSKYISGMLIFSLVLPGPLKVSLVTVCGDLSIA